MTQEQKAKAYDEAIRKIKGMMPIWEHLSYNGKTFLQDIVSIFPELKGNEGERVRKELISWLKTIKFPLIESAEKAAEWVAWLKKQGQKPVIIPKFREGEKVMLKPQFRMQNDDTPPQNTIREIVSIEDGWYKCDNGCSFNIEDQDKFVLVGQKSAWSEEDEIKIKSIIAFLKSPSLCAMDGNKGIIDANIKYLKSIKDRVQSKSQYKPSEEQLYFLHWLATNVLTDGEVDKKASEILNTLYNYLKKL